MGSRPRLVIEVTGDGDGPLVDRVQTEHTALEQRVRSERLIVWISVS